MRLHHGRQHGRLTPREIVAGADIFDLPTGDPRARPDAAAGYAACRAATGHPGVGAVGAGTGATVAKAGGGQPRPGGVGIASAPVGAATVAAVMVANSLGGIWDDERHEWVAPLAPGQGAPGPVAGAHTTIGVVVTDAELTREQANRVAAAAHDGIARAVRPAHTRFDGDTIFCLATGAVAAPSGGGRVLPWRIWSRWPPRRSWPGRSRKACGKVAGPPAGECRRGGPCGLGYCRPAVPVPCVWAQSGVLPLRV